jgi:hypothetical protein
MPVSLLILSFHQWSADSAHSSAHFAHLSADVARSSVDMPVSLLILSFHLRYCSTVC